MASTLTESKTEFKPYFDKHHLDDMKYKLKQIKFNISKVNKFVSENQDCLKNLDCKLVLHDLIMELIKNVTLLKETSQYDIDAFLINVVPHLGSEYSKYVDIALKTYTFMKTKKHGLEYYFVGRDTHYIGQTIFNVVHQKCFYETSYDVCQKIINMLELLMKSFDTNVLYKMSLEKVEELNKLITLINQYKSTSDNFKLVTEKDKYLDEQKTTEKLELELAERQRIENRKTELINKLSNF